MSAIDLLIMIVRRETDDKYSSFLREMGMHMLYSVPANGTAGKHLLDMLGLEESEKTVMFGMTQRTNVPHVLRAAVSRMGLDMPGNGIALSIPADAIGGAGSMKALLGDINLKNDEGKDKMEEKQEYPCALIMAICERGNSETVMDAARAAGAGGGTVIHARGTASDTDEKFFGVSIAPEKDMLLIVTRQSDKAAIMRAIMDKAGIHSPAHTVLFALPVSTVAGLRSVMDAEV